MTDIAKLIADLLSSGQTGLAVAGLIVILCAGAYIIWLQRQSMQRMDTIMKATEVASHQRISASQEAKEASEKQFEIVLKINDELRKELERQKLAQQKFEDDVKNALNVGFREIKDTLGTVTVSEIIAEIPESFREDLEKELSQTLEKAVNGLIRKIQEADIQEKLFPQEELTYRLEKVGNNVYNELIKQYSLQIDKFNLVARNRVRDNFIDMFEEIANELRHRKILIYTEDQQALNYLARAIAEKLKLWPFR